MQCFFQRSIIKYYLTIFPSCLGYPVCFMNFDTSTCTVINHLLSRKHFNRTWLISFLIREKNLSLKQSRYHFFRLINCFQIKLCSKYLYFSLLRSSNHKTTRRILCHFKISLSHQFNLTFISRKL